MSAPVVYVTEQITTVTTGAKVQNATSFITTTSHPQESGYLPLTTRFTQPAHCQNTLLARQNYFVLGYQDDCYPSGHDNVVAYSPGLCPTGFEMAGLEVHLSYAYVASVEPKPARISMAYCCPSGFSYQDQHVGIPTAFLEPCASTAIAGLPTSWPLVNASFSTIGAEVLAGGSRAILSPFYTSAPLPTDVKSAIIRASGIQVAWQSTDSDIVKLVGTSAATLDASATAFSSPSSGGSGSGGLSRTGIILIAVLVPVLTLMLIAAGILLCLRHRKKKAALAAGGVGGKQSDASSSEEAIDSHSEGASKSMLNLPVVVDQESTDSGVEKDMEMKQDANVQPTVVATTTPKAENLPGQAI